MCVVREGGYKLNYNVSTLGDKYIYLRYEWELLYVLKETIHLFLVRIIGCNLLTSSSSFFLEKKKKNPSSWAFRIKHFGQFYI